MADFVDDSGEIPGIGLAEAIGLLRQELLRARAAGAGTDVHLPVESMTVELVVTASRSVDGKAGFKVPFTGAELGAGRVRGQATEQRVTVVFGEPVDAQGRPVKVARHSGELKE
ncbi:hypothetical protein OG788_39230 [Streptomyces sp. NBC_00647]|uniref:trypco2 family protein n=1 Tax=Streptomyces sp. NBC_00647 TaxID=2975796 RepID=UPI0032454949